MNTSAHRVFRGLCSLSRLQVIALATVVAIGGFLFGMRLSTAAVPAERIVFAASTDTTPAIAGIVNGLQQKGFTLTRDTRQFTQALGPSTRSIVFTPTTFQMADISQMRLLYQRGVTLVVLDMALPTLVSAIDPTSSAPGGSSAVWLQPSPSYTIFSLVRKVVSKGVLLQRTSDRIVSVDAFVGILSQSEQTPTR